jgi:RHS repeat-associated protein
VKMKAYESRLALLLLSVLVASMAGRAFAALPQNAPPGMRMYVLALRGAGTAPAADREPDLARLGGILVEAKRDLRIIYLPPERLEELRHDPRVAFVQRVGALAEDARVQTPVARQTKSSPVPRPVTPASVGLTTWEYEYDGSGNVARINGSESSSAYAYDLMNRLTTATVGSAQQTYTYDAFGNRASKAEGTQTTTFGVDPATNRLMSQTVNGTVAWTLEYDEAGHVKKDRAGHAYQFDAAGMLNHMTTTTSRNRRMIYTAGDERIAVIDTFSGGKETEFTVRDFAGRVLRVWYQTDGMPLWQRDYVYADGGLIAEVRNVDAAEDPVHHFHADHLGSIRLTTAGSTGVLTCSHEFWPFGEEITSTVQESFERVQPMKFTGHERDYISAVNNESTDYLDYMHARYYTATLGRFLSVDPIVPSAATRQPQRWNRYAYVANNPMKNTDPTGKLLEVRAGTCDDKSPCYSKLDSFQAVKNWVGSDAAKYLVLGKNGQVTLAKGMSFAQFAKFGGAAGIVANLMRSTDRTAAFALSSNVKDDRGNATPAFTRPEAGGTFTEINPAMFPRIEGGAAQTMDTAMAHDLGGHGLLDMWGISPRDARYGSMDQRFTLGVNWGEAFAVTFENQYRAAQGMDIRGYYMNPYDYDPPPGAPKP